MGLRQIMKCEKGITLIALIITIIILIILSAISIKAIWQHNIINIAAVSAEKYINAEKKEEEILDYLDKKLRGDTNLSFTTEGYCSDRFTNYINISAIAKNKFEDELTYTIHWGTTKDYEKEEIVKKLPSGEEVTFELKDLENYTIYYYRVDVADDITDVEGIEGEVRTYCPTTKCDGPFTTTKNCGSCGGSGKILGDHTYNFYTWRWDTQREPCEVCGTRQQKRVVGKLKCDYCQNDMSLSSDMDYCSTDCCRKEYRNRYGQKCSSNKSTCGTCGGSGKVPAKINCTHGKGATHWHCEHGNDFTTNYHADL